MKRLLSLGVLILLALSVVLAVPSYSMARGGHGGGHGAGWFIGGLALGTILGSAVVPPYYYGPAYAYPAPVYVYRAPVYVYPGENVNRAYAYPDPAYSAPPAGEWVVVPGQWIGGKWVPEHKAWVPAN